MIQFSQFHLFGIINMRGGYAMNTILSLQKLQPKDFSERDAQAFSASSCLSNSC